MMAERAQHCSFTKHMQIERHQQINKTSPSCAAHPHNPTKYRNVDFKTTTKVKMKYVMFIFAAHLCFCVVSICSACVFKLMKTFSLFAGVFSFAAR